MRVERGGVPEGWVLGTGELGVVTKADLVGECTEEPVDALFGFDPCRIVENSEVYPELYTAGMKYVAPVVEDSLG